ncbi:MAG: photosystem I reaction center subunit PsaK [Calothrix sp. C42_A2020_038]|nr:photosystem I reaction center subunit PsaK [Calothrix sp. C42_A2020_038]
MILSFLLAVATNVPATPTWTPTIGLIISLSSFVALLLTLKIEKPLVGPKMPLLPLSIPAFVAAMCFGHIIGIGIILGLTNIGRL